METQKLFYDDPYLREADCSVTSCVQTQKGWLVELDRTIFYPTGGGQPCDLGTLDEAQVVDVSQKEGRLLHLCDRPLETGQMVHARIDWERRFMLMQQNSGEHLVSGLIHQHFGFDNVGFHMGADAVTIDFSGEISQEDMQRIEAEANRVIWANLERELLFPDAETLSTLDYRSKKELSGWVRLVRFPGVDLCACCGLHVARTGEIGLIKLLSATRFHGGSRLELLCGARALEWVNVVAAQNSEVSALLSARQNATAAAVRRQTAELQATQLRAAQLEGRLIAHTAAAYAGAQSVLHFDEGFSADGVRRLADAISAVCAGRCAVFVAKADGWNYAIADRAGDLRAFTGELNRALRGRGGGKADFVQGAVSATRAEIEAFFTAEKR